MEIRDMVRDAVARARRTPPLRGERVKLRAVEEGDLPLLVRWINDPEVRYWLHHSDRPDATVETVRGRFGLSDDGFPNLVWMIETLRVLPQTQPPTQGRLLRVLPQNPAHSGQAEGRPVGHVGLLYVDAHHKRAELAISIGEKDCWSRGYGTDAIRAVLRHAFEEMGLWRVDLHTDADNVRGIRCYEKCGFVREGVMRERRLRYGKPLDMALMGALAREWEKSEVRGRVGGRRSEVRGQR